jgi:hypothetical protein
MASPDRISPAPRRRLVYAACAFLAIVFFRFAVAIILIPALLAWLLTLHPPPRRQSWIIGGIGTAIILILLQTRLLDDLAAQQHSFMVLKGNSLLYLPTLDGTWTSLLRAIPAALRNGLFEPLPGSGGQRIYQLFALELLCIWTIAAAAIAAAIVKRSVPSPFSLCCLILALAGMLQIGLIIPFAGAIIRYRSIYLPFLTAPCLYSLRNWQPLRSVNAWFSRTFLMNYE